MKNCWYSLFLMIFLLFSCSNDDTADPIDPMNPVDPMNPIDDPVDMGGLSDDQQLAIDYFTEIALGFEFGNATQVTRKWDTDIFITIAGAPTTALLEELDSILNELNELIAASEIEIQITDDPSIANFTIFMGSGEDYATFFPPAAPFVSSNFGLFFVSFDANQFLTGASMYVDTFRPTSVKQRHLLREELTQALGLARDSNRFPESIFQISFDIGCATTYSQFDEILIQLLYDPRVATNLSEAEVRTVLEGIIDEFL